MDQVRVGIIGFGGMGSYHGRYLAAGQVPDAVLTAVCDIDPARLDYARSIAGDGIALFDNADAFFASGTVDAFLVATPHYFHPPLAIQGLQAGLHALVEKPAGVYTKQVREMNEIAGASGKVFGIMFNQRTSRCHQQVRQLVQSGELGEIRRVSYTITDWFRTQSYYNSGGWRATWDGEGGGVLLNQCPHNLDLWQWICGMPTRVRAFMSFGKYHNIEVEDDVTAFVEYANGATGVFTTTTGEAPGINRLEIAGDRGLLTLQGGQITFKRTVTSVQEHLNTCPEGFTAPECWSCEVPGGDGEQHIGITKNWVNAILHGTPLLGPGVEGINGLTLSNAMHLSAWTDSWVELPLDEDLFYAKLQEKIATSTFKKEAVAGKANEFVGTF